MTENFNAGNIRDIIHDLKTPITSIIGFIELLQKGSHSEKDMDEFYGIIDSEAHRLLKMINDILYASKNSMPNPDDKCNISIEIHKYVKALKPLAQKNNINIDINVNSGSIYVSIPENKISRILLNIIENAIKYNKESGKIFITVTEENNIVSVSIKDTGLGISDDDLNKIFDKYYRSKDSRKLGIDGSGLGLAIAKDIVESYKGNISVKSKLGESTEFIISFPSAQIPK